MISSAPAGELLWPMKLTPELTSKFCDYRGGHFHSGLDIRTQGKTGFPIYAVDDGYVYRAAVSFRGYGKALYLKLKDNRIAVFGHLSDFTPSLRERIRATQMKESKYAQDLFFTTSEFPVKRGEVIAYSGATGSGAPHLHFEIRSSGNNPINPLGAGVDIPDRSAPIFDDLGIRYYRPGFDFGDPCELEFVPAVKAKVGGAYTIPDTLISDGPLVLSVSGGDRIGGPGFLYGFYGLQLFIDDSLAYEMDSDSLSFNTTRQLNYIRDNELIRLYGSRNKTDNDANIFYRLVVPPGSRQFFWNDNSDRAGVISENRQSDGIMQIKIAAYDEYDNRSEMRFFIRTPGLLAPANLEYIRRGDTLLVSFETAEKISGVKAQYRNSSLAPYKSINAKISTKQSDSSSPIFFNTLRLVIAPGGREFRFAYYDDRGEVSPWTYSKESKSPRIFEISGAPGHLKVDYHAKAAHDFLRLSINNQAEQHDYEMMQSGPRLWTIDIMGKNFSGPTKFTVSAGDGVLFDTSLVLYPVFPESALDISSPDSTMVTIFQPGSAYYPTYVFPTSAMSDKRNRR